MSTIVVPKAKKIKYSEKTKDYTIKVAKPMFKENKKELEMSIQAFKSSYYTLVKSFNKVKRVDFYNDLGQVVGTLFLQKDMLNLKELLDSVKTLTFNRKQNENINKNKQKTPKRVVKVVITNIELYKNMGKVVAK